MKLGITTNYTWFGPPITEIARTIEALGFESMWMGEHPIIPVAAAEAVRYGVPLPANYRHMPALLVSLAAAAAVTSKIRLGTNICIVPQRDPVLLALRASLDRTRGLGRGRDQQKRRHRTGRHHARTSDTREFHHSPPHRE